MGGSLRELFLDVVDPGSLFGVQLESSPSSANHRPSSNSAVSAPSDACTRLLENDMPKSPRIVPGSASRQFVLPTMRRTTAMASLPSSASATTGPEPM